MFWLRYLYFMLSITLSPREGYNVSSETTFPGIRYTGRLATDSLGTMPQGENTFVDGTGSQTGDAANRWGDYSAMSVDPVDDNTFWFTGEYALANGNWATRIGSFSFGPTVIESIIGTEGDDVLTGTNGRDLIEGLGGNDIIQGLAGNDQISGGSGDDLISAGDGNDTVEGNDGQDDILGGDGDDLLNGHSGEDRILGESGDDTISGDRDSDIVDGGEGSDSVSGDRGSDRVFGGTGEVDTLTRAAERDTFVLGDENRVYYNDGDPLSTGESDFAVIADFEPSQDFIQLKEPADVYSLDLFTSELGTIDADLIFDPGASARGEVIATLQDVSPDLSFSDPSFIFV